MINNKIKLNIPENIPKRCSILSQPTKMCAKVVGASSDIFGNVRKSSENRWKCLEIPVMTRQKPHAFDPEKVSRDNLVLIFCGNEMDNFC